MMKRFSRTGWMAIGLILGLSFGGSALTFAGSGSETPKPEKSKVVREQKASKGAEASEAKSANASKDKARSAEVRAQNGNGTHERKANHGYYVSRAAHCEDVDDPESGFSANAPNDCETDGAAHGAYVKSVAESNAGKKDNTED